MWKTVATGYPKPPLYTQEAIVIAMVSFVPPLRKESRYHYFSFIDKDVQALRGQGTCFQL